MSLIKSGSRVHVASSKVDSDAFLLQDTDTDSGEKVNVRLINNDETQGDLGLFDLSKGTMHLVEGYEEPKEVTDKVKEF